MRIEELQAAMKQAVDQAAEAAAKEAYERGFREGSQAAAAKILRAIEAAAHGAPVPALKSGDVAIGEATVHREPRPSVVKVPHHGKRAPRGLTKAVLKRVLSHGIGLPMAEVQRRAVSMDSRVSPKTVYNELYREPEYWKDDRGNWWLLSPEQQASVRAEQLRLTEEVARDLGLTEAPQEREGPEALTAH